MESLNKPYQFRAYHPNDIAFLQNSWGKSYYAAINHPQSTDPYKGISSREFHKLHRPFRDKVLQSPNTAVIVCCYEYDPDLILGYLILDVFQRLKENIVTIHYVYVKFSLRSQGIAKELYEKLNPKEAFYSHHTIQAERIMKHHPHIKFKEKPWDQDQ